MIRDAREGLTLKISKIQGGGKLIGFNRQFFADLLIGGFSFSDFQGGTPPTLPSGHPCL